VHDKYQINRGKTIYREAYEQRNVDKLLSVFAPGGFTDMSDGLPSKYGQEARDVLRERAEELFAGFDIKLNIIIIEIVIQGDSAYDYGWHEWILSPKGGGANIHRRERYFEQWGRESDGTWRISFFLNNADVPEQVGNSVSRWFMTEEPSPI
jgi:ketosteroid isomerase-like protein